jgi:hypothetical protein
MPQSPSSGQEALMRSLPRRRQVLVRGLVIGSALLTLACKQTSAPAASNPAADAWYSRTITGTWGGDDAGLIASDSSAHAHIGCTFGDTKGPIITDGSGHFDTPGTFDVDAYPVARDIVHPARFTGEVKGQTMVLTVVLTDTTRTLGPVILTYGKEPQMGVCPICRIPGHKKR